MRNTYALIIALTLLAGCEMSGRSRTEHPDAGKTIVEIRAMSYPDPSEGERPPQTYVNTNESDIKSFDQWLRSQRSGWQTMAQMPDRRPSATCAMIYGDGKTVNFAMDGHDLIRGNQKLPLNESDYEFVKRICLKR